MAQSGINLADLFNSALQSMTSHRQEVNDLDGYNGNHGDNMVDNLSLITEVLRSNPNLAPADALRQASDALASQGRGGTSQFYSKGLQQAAGKMQGRSSLGSGDVMSLVQSLLGAIPSQGYPQQAQAQAGGSVLDQVLGAMGGGQAPVKPQRGRQGLMGILRSVLPAGLAFLQARQSGAHPTAAAGQALISALTGASANPLQAGTPRAAAGGLVAQGILQALLGGG